MHDPLLIGDLLADEVQQRIQSGYDVADIAHRLEQLDHPDERQLEELYLELTHTSQSAEWSYVEPDDLDTITAAWPAGDEPVLEVQRDRILGAWLGRIAGCNLGKPIEEGNHWTADRIRAYLTRTNSYPLRDYIPATPELAEEFQLRENWPHTTLGRVEGSDRDDDIDYPILGLHMLEQHGDRISADDVAAAWLAYFPYTRVYTAERATYVNLLHNVPAERAAEVRNPYREWIGALIRGDVFGWISPGRPRAAATLAYRDAVLSHRGNGIYGEMWAAALCAASQTAATVQETLDAAQVVVPPRSRLAEAINHVRELHAANTSWDSALQSVRERYGHYSWVHTVNNAALITMGLLWSDGDYSAAVGNTVQGGWDTDSNGATVGSIMGGLLGAEALPAYFINPLHDRTRSAVFGYDNSRISELAERTVSLANTVMP
jgi:ADP-ribosylglycohydrolase